MTINKTLVASVLLALASGAPDALAAPQPGRAQAPSALTAAASNDMVQFNVYLPLRHQEQLDQLLAQLHDTNSPKYHQWLQPSEFLAQFGPSKEQLARVRDALTARGFTIVSSNAHGVRVSGPASLVASTFNAPVKRLSRGNRTRYMTTDAMHMPSELAGIGVRVLGLEPIAEHHVHSHTTKLTPAAVIDNRYTASGAYWFDDLKQAYDYPAYSAKTDGTGVSVAVLMADLIFPGDVQAAFDHEKFTAITGKAAPSVTTVTVDGGGVTDGYGSFEASLDVQQVLGGAPGSTVTLVSIPDLSDQSVIDGYTYIVDSNQYDIVNSSFGGCELAYTAAYNAGVDYTYILQAEHEIYAQGNAQGITFVASSGDEGALQCPSVNYFSADPTATFVPGVSSPASDPDVTGVGGGNLVTAHSSGSLSSAYVRESAFGDPEQPYDPFGLGTAVSGGYWGAGGGVSSVFSKPAYQFLTDTGSKSARTVPDVGMQVGGLGFSGLNGSAPGFCNDTAISCSPDDSSVLTAYGAGIGGGFYFTIGTSVSSPEFVGALALFEQKLGKHHRVGNVNYYLYAAGALQSVAGGVNAPPSLQFYHRQIPGFDGLYDGSAPGKNYSYLYGNGSPDVRKLFGLTSYPAAGLPQTPSNP